MAETYKEKYIKKEIKVKRLNVTLILLIICFAISCLYLINYGFTLCQKISSHYMLGIISAFIGLTCRSFLFRNDFDQYKNDNKNNKIRPVEEQYHIIHEAYFLKYPLLIVLYSVLSVSLIHFFTENAEMITSIHIPLLSATNILVGLKIEYQKLF